MVVSSSTFLDFYVGKAIWSSQNIDRKKILLIISLVGNLSILGFFKYADFAILQLNFFGETFNLSNEIPLLDLALPVGISFYTFQTMSYTIDIYRGKLKPSESLKEFSIFVGFFPQLVAGPIIRARLFLPQLREKLKNNTFLINPRQILIHDSNLKIGITLMAIGFFKKMFFADNIAGMVNDVFSSPVGMESFTIIIATIGYGVQIYADFSGYSDIAIGALIILGFKIPMNFNKPYFAVSPVDFWRRWHISLSTWLKDYLYIPLGGNKKGNRILYQNLLVVMILGGLWHGASWNFVIWGLLHGTYLVIYRIISSKIPIKNKNKSKLVTIIGILITQYFVFLAWIPFRVQDLDLITYSMWKYVFWDFQYLKTLDFINSHEISIGLVVIFLILNFISYKTNIVERISKIKLVYWFGFLLTITSLILFMYSGYSEDFIYFKF